MEPNQAVGEFTISVTGDGVSFERTVGPEKAGAVMAMLLGASAIPAEVRGPASLPQMPLGAVSSERHPPMSLREFLDECQPKKNPEKIVAIAEYLIEHGGQENVDRDAIKSEFQRAREIMPKNFSRDFNLVVGSGWISEVVGRAGRFYVTNKGREAIASKFARGSTKPSTRRRRGPGRRGHAAGPTSDE